MIIVAAEGGGERLEHGTGVDEQLQLAEDARALFVECEAVVAMECAVLHQFAGLATSIRPGTEEVVAEPGGVDVLG